MICGVCQSILQLLDAHIIPRWPSMLELPHHRTSPSFKQSVDAGCYICNRVWWTLKSDIQQLIYAMADSQALRDRNGGSVEVAAAEAFSNSVTTFTMMEALPYDHPECYKLDVSCNLNTIPPWNFPRGRASFLLEPANGKAKLLSLWSKLF